MESASQPGNEASFRTGDKGPTKNALSSYGDPPLRGAILGSTPNKLLHIADRPVLVVPGHSG